MNKYVVTEELTAILNNQAPLPTTVLWNRLEGRPRSTDFTRALKAEVHDPLWLITRQWQMGEFIGEDAGSPVTAKVAWKTDRVTELHLPSGATQSYDPDLPLEAVIEARDVPLTRDGRIHNADLRLAWGAALEETAGGRGPRRARAGLPRPLWLRGARSGAGSGLPSHGACSQLADPGGHRRARHRWRRAVAASVRARRACV